jgi:hypothetical protein
MNKRPLSVTVASYVIAAAGVVGLAYHFSEWTLRPFHSDIVWVSLVRVIAIACGVAMLRGHNWARWLTMVWIAFHVALSFWHSWSEVAMHVLLLAVFAYVLFRQRANQYFRTQEPQ